MDLPGFDMPPVLENMFKYLLNTYGHIRGWNIYENDRGFINLNIRFNNVVYEDSDSSGHARFDPVMYKRISSKQVTRNRSRAQAYKSVHNTPSKIKEDHTTKPNKIQENQNNKLCEIGEDHTDGLPTTKKRKCDDLSPELSRSEYIEPAFNVNNLDSPEIISKSFHPSIESLHP